MQYNQINPVINMEFTLQDYLDELRWANETMRRYEERFKKSSEDFLALYNQGKLDDGENMAEKAEWSAACEIKMDRELRIKELMSNNESR